MKRNKNEKRSEKQTSPAAANQEGKRTRAMSKRTGAGGGGQPQVHRAPAGCGGRGSAPLRPGPGGAWRRVPSPLGQQLAHLPSPQKRNRQAAARSGCNYPRKPQTFSPQQEACSWGLQRAARPGPAGPPGGHTSGLGGKASPARVSLGLL